MCKLLCARKICDIQASISSSLSLFCPPVSLLSLQKWKRATLGAKSEKTNSTYIHTRWQMKITVVELCTDTWCTQGAPTDKQTMASRILFGRIPSNSYIHISNKKKPLRWDEMRWECLCNNSRCFLKERNWTIIIRMYVRILTLRRDAVHCCLVSHTIQRNPSLHLTSLQCSVPLFRTDSAGCDSSPLPRGVLNDGQTDRPLDKWRPSMLRMLILLLCSALLCATCESRYTV